MTEFAWLPAILVAVGGLAVGLVIAAIARRRGEAASARAEAPAPLAAPTLETDPVLDDLRHRKVELIEQLRDLEDTWAGRGAAELAAERTRLERAAADVMKRLAEREAALDEGLAGAAPVTAAPRRAGGLSPGLKGALVGGGVALFGLALVLALQSGSRPREEGMGITGNDPSRMGGGAMAGGAVAPGGEQEAGSLDPVPSPELDAARARVAANPGDLDALVELGYALVEARGWIEVYKVSRQILDAEPDNADGLLLAAHLGLAMSQPDRAREIIDRVRKAEPDHPRALALLGVIRYMDNDREGARELWSRGKEVTGDAEFDELLAVLDQPHPAMMDTGGSGKAHPPVGEGAGGGLPAGHPPMGEAAPGLPAGHPPMGGGAAPGGASPPAPGGGIAGTIALAEGVSPPAGGVLFVMARAKGQTAGPPVAVARLPAGGFPVAFSLGPANLMMQGSDFPAEVSLSARLDADGNVMTKGDGDLQATLPQPVAAGSSGVTLVLR